MLSRRLKHGAMTTLGRAESTKDLTHTMRAAVQKHPKWFQPTLEILIEVHLHGVCLETTALEYV